MYGDESMKSITKVFEFLKKHDLDLDLDLDLDHDANEEKVLWWWS